MYLGCAEQEVGTVERRKRNNLLQRAVSSPKEWSRARRPRQCGPRGICAAWSMHFEEDCARPRSCPDGPSFNAPITQTCSAKAVNGHPSRVAAVRIGWDGFSTAPTGSNGRASAKTVRRVHDVPATQTAPRQAKTSREAGEGIAICERA